MSEMVNLTYLFILHLIAQRVSVTYRNVRNTFHREKKFEKSGSGKIWNRVEASEKKENSYGYSGRHTNSSRLPGGRS